MERTGGIEANAAHSKKARRAEKRKKAPTKIVGVKPKTANFTIDTFDMSKPIDILTDVCAMCKHVRNCLDCVLFTSFLLSNHRDMTLEYC